MIDGSNGVAPPTGTGVPLVLANHSTKTPFLGLSFSIWFLNIVTLTLYRFWGRTRVRQQPWRDTTLNGEPFEYTGTGMELFKGFLIALAVFTIPYLVVVFAAQLLPPLIGIPLLIAVLLVAYWGIGAAIWLSFRYLASRTTWRGIRFELVGSAVDYAWTFARNFLLVIITLGWWWPRMALEVAKPLWGDLFYGSRRIEFDMEEARKEPLYGSFAIAWIVGVVGYLIIVSAIALPSPELMRFVLEGDSAERLALIYLAGLLAWLIAVMIAQCFYQAAELRAIVRGIRIDQAVFRSGLKWNQILWLSFSNALLIVFSLGILIPMAQMRTARATINHLYGEGTADIENATQAERGPNQAEGLADSLDVGFI